MKLLVFLLVLTSSYSALSQDKTEFKFDFNEFKIATAEYPKGPTGMTLLFFPKGAHAAVDIRGGSATVLASSAVDDMNSWGYVDGIVLSGGSALGLESATGVMSAILKQRKNNVHFDSIPLVPAAIVYDFPNRKNAIYPDKDLGIKAFNSLKENSVAVGRAGAGTNVSVGKYMGIEKAESAGQGAAYKEVSGIKLFVLTVNNALGAIHDRDGKVIRGNLDLKTGIRSPVYESILASQEKAPEATQNTTISVIVTNADISRIDMKRIAVMAHTSMASTIRPFQTPWDGDTLFVVSTQSKKLPKNLGVASLGVISSELLTQALLRSVNAEKY
ncbi:MAG TPA: P1 family peptidase [Bacteriovoracaceae bacterium]|nr:P1 family peptidase [Bacteriovoracaceae bacterium]